MGQVHRRTFLRVGLLAGVAAITGDTVIARRLLIAGGGAASFVAPPRILTLTSAPQGGWTQIQDPKAFYYNGATYFAYAPDTGSTGDIVVGKYVHSTGVTTTHVLASAYENPPDNHSSPSVIVLPDGRLMVGAAHHAEVTSPSFWVSTNPEDITSWNSPMTPDAVIGAAQYTYIVMYPMADGKVYVFYRDYISGTNTGRLGYTTWDGVTLSNAGWTGRKILYTGATGHVPYWRIISDPANDLIHVFVTDVEPDSSALGHFYFDIGAVMVHASDGTPLTWNGTSTLLDWSDITLVQGATCWSWGASVDALGRPAAVIMRDVGSDNAIDVARWRSGAWQVDEVVASVGGQVTGNQYASGAAIHHANPNLVYYAKKDGSHWEMFKARSVDDGATWSETQLTTGSTGDNLWPEVPHNAGVGLSGLWPCGAYTSDTNYSFGIRGLA